jgi:Protein of unknown function (DUF1592)/Protein of unknown function (DUF1588)/Protein of unknown function (DUF1587)/Protein of unknown function (DUF1595)
MKRPLTAARRTAATAALLTASALAGCYGAGSPEGGAPAAKATASALTPPMRRLRRLSHREYDATVRDLLGDTSQPARRFLGDAYANGYDNGSAALAVQTDLAAQYEAAAEALAAAAVARDLGALTGGCDGSTSSVAACEEGFLASLAPRAYRRPLTVAEQDRLRAVMAADAELGGTLATGIQTALELVLQSPQFLSREELGPAGADPARGNVTLTPYEVASQLSYLLTGTLPDAPLWAAAQEGRFETADDRAREARRLLASPHAQETLRAFFHAWLATSELATATKDARTYPSFGPAMAGAMATELDRFFDGVMVGGAGSLREMFTSTTGYVDPTLAQLYGVAAPAAPFAPVALGADLRKGVLTRAGFLATHAAADSSGPVARGVFVMQSLLCAPPPPPPPNVPAVAAAGTPETAGMTTRQRFERHARDPACAGCHTTIDGFGFGFEQFDGIGAFRATEGGQPVDTRGTVAGTGEIDGDFTGASELAARLAGSRHLTACFARQAYRFAMGQIEPPGDDPAGISPAFGPDAPMTDILLSIAAAELFTTRAFEGSP